MTTWGRLSNDEGRACSWPPRLPVHHHPLPAAPYWERRLARLSAHSLWARTLGDTAATSRRGYYSASSPGSTMYYLTQTVYSMAGYRTLQDIVSGYFAHRHWYCGEDRDDDLRSWPLAERWKDERDSCYVSAISMRSWYSLIGHGVRYPHQQR